MTRQLEALDTLLEIETGDIFAEPRSLETRVISSDKTSEQPEIVLEDGDPRLFLHYAQPAKEWSEALPLGNGRLGCMIYGRTDTELLQLNENSVWYGGPKQRTPTPSRESLAQLRKAIQDGDHQRAEVIAKSFFFGRPSSMGHSEPLGNVCITYNISSPVENYRRVLDIGRAVHMVQFTVKGVKVSQSTFSSFPDESIITKIQAERPIRFLVSLTRVGEHAYDTNQFLDSVLVDEAEGLVQLNATPGGQNSRGLSITLKALCHDDGGQIFASERGLVITSAACSIILGARTGTNSLETERRVRQEVSQISHLSFNSLWRRHLSDYSALFKKSLLEMGPDAFETPTDERLATWGKRRDNGLVALFYNFSRYLLISCSRGQEGSPSLPAHLQGIWNPSFSPPWGCRYTLNINTQMNYWPAGQCNLAPCVIPLIDLLERMAESGSLTAKQMYNAQGWCCHHNTDIWADTAPAESWMPATLWPLGGAWLTLTVIDILQYEDDPVLLQRMMPVLDGSIEFLLGFLVPSKDGKHLSVNPSLSPENTFSSETGNGIFCESSAMDISITRTIFHMYLWSQSVLPRPDPQNHTAKIRRALGVAGSPGELCLPSLTLNPDGLIQEWGMKDYAEAEPGHRHVSHLFGLYPGDLIDPFSTPELADAARKVLIRREAHGGGHTGWSRAWLLNLYARLHDGKACAEQMDKLFQQSTLSNMFNSHPPFQIDGNFGGGVGISQCLVYSALRKTSLNSGDEGQYFSEVRLLPACPDGWSDGKLVGCLVKGYWKITLSWAKNKLAEVVMERTSSRAHRSWVWFSSGRGLWIEPTALRYYLRENSDGVPEIV